MLIPLPHDDRDSKTRSIAKAITWRCVGSLDNFAIGWYLTGYVAGGVATASIEVFTGTILYYFHERIWSHIPNVHWLHDTIVSIVHWKKGRKK